MNWLKRKFHYQHVQWRSGHYIALGECNISWMPMTIGMDLGHRLTLVYLRNEAYPEAKWKWPRFYWTVFNQGIDVGRMVLTIRHTRKRIPRYDALQ